jgi:Rrf2 family protein
MKISTKGHYGLLAIVDLVINSGGDRVPLKSIATRQNISEAYLEQIFSALRKANIVKSIKGPQGGYMLVEDSAKVTVGQVLRVTEGVLFDYKKESQGVIEEVVCNSVWGELEARIDGVVDTITIEALVEECRKKMDGGNMMYYI